MLKFSAKYCCKLKVAGSDSHYRVIRDFAVQSIFYMDGCFWGEDPANSEASGEFAFVFVTGRWGREF